MAPYYGGYDPSAQAKLRNVLIESQMQNRRPLEMQAAIPYDPQVSGGYSGQIEGHSGPAQFASLIGNLAKSIGPQILAGREAKRKQDATTRWGNIVNQSKRVMGPYAPQEGREPYRLRTPTERVDNIVSTGLQDEYPEVRKAATGLAVEQALKDPPPLTAAKTYYPPQGSKEKPTSVREKTQEETDLLNKGYTTARITADSEIVTGAMLRENYDTALDTAWDEHLFSHVDGQNIKHVKAPVKQTETAMQAKVRMYMEMGADEDRAKALALGAEEPIIDFVTNRVLGIYNSVDKSYIPIEAIAGQTDVPSELHELLLTPEGGYSSEDSILANLQQYGPGGAIRETLAKAPVGADMLDYLFTTGTEKVLGWFGKDAPEGHSDTPERVVELRTSYQQFANDAIRALKQSSKASVPEQARIIRILPDLGLWENPVSAGAALRSISLDMGRVLEANKAVYRDTNQGKDARLEAQAKIFAVAGALRMLGYDPQQGSNFYTEQGISKLTLEEINEVPEILIDDLIATSPALVRLINDRRKALEEESMLEEIN